MNKFTLNLNLFSINSFLFCFVDDYLPDKSAFLDFLREMTKNSQIDLKSVEDYKKGVRATLRRFEPLNRR